MLPPDPEAPLPPQNEGQHGTDEGATGDSGGSRSINDDGNVDSSEGMFSSMFETAVGMAAEAAAEQLELPSSASTAAVADEQSEQQDEEESAGNCEEPKGDTRDNGDDADSDDSGDSEDE